MSGTERKRDITFVMTVTEVMNSASCYGAAMAPAWHQRETVLDWHEKWGLGE